MSAEILVRPTLARRRNYCSSAKESFSERARTHSLQYKQTLTSGGGYFYPSCDARSARGRALVIRESSPPPSTRAAGYESSIPDCLQFPCSRIVAQSGPLEIDMSRLKAHWRFARKLPALDRVIRFLSSPLPTSLKRPLSLGGLSPCQRVPLLLDDDGPSPIEVATRN